MGNPNSPLPQKMTRNFGFKIDSRRAAVLHRRASSRTKIGRRSQRRGGRRPAMDYASGGFSLFLVALFEIFEQRSIGDLGDGAHAVGQEDAVEMIGFMLPDTGYIPLG